MAENEERDQNPEMSPQIGPNGWDIARVLMLPLLGFFQGCAAAADALQDFAILQSQVHDEKKAVKGLANLLK